MENQVLELPGSRQSQVVVSVVGVLLTGLLLFWFSQSTARRKRLPPGPGGWPILGSLPSLGAFPHTSLFKLSKRYGPVMFMRFGTVPFIIISNAEMAKEVLQTNDQIFASRPRLLIPTYLLYDQKDLAFSAYGPHWREKLIKQEIMAVIHSVLRQSQLGKAVDMSNLFSGMTMNIVTNMMWNTRHIDIDSEEKKTDKFEEIAKTVMSLCGSNNIADFLPFFKSLAMKLTGFERKAKETHEELDKFFEKILSEREKASSTKTDATTDKDDFVDVLLKLLNQSENFQGLTRDIVKAILTDMLVAGTETSSVTLDWALAELMRNPTMMKKAQDELMRVIGNDRLVNESDIPKLKYIGAFLKETLRRHGAGPLSIPRLSMSNCKIGRFDVPSDTMVLINFFAINHDPTVWEKPMEFNPDRFLESELDYRGRHFEFLPFGSGRRICPGINLASSVLHLGLAQLLHTISWSLPRGQKPEDIDMTENTGLSLSRANPLLVIGRPQLAHHVIYPVGLPPVS